jgi:sporulation protein YlmC with PRC-barrel domain
MNRLLACTAVGLFLGLAPALAETQPPAPDQQDQPALDQPAQPSEAMPAEPATPDAAMPANPGASNEEPAETPGQSSEMAPDASPSDQASPPAVGEAAPSDQASPPAVGEATPPPASPEAPKSAEASPSGGAFLAKQDSSDWLVGNLIGKSVVNADNESIGDVNDLVTDQNGKIIAIVVGAGGFLGIGEKDVAIRFEDVKLARDENNDVKVIADINKETLASAPDYETLDEQQITVGEGGDQDRAQ